MVAIRDPRGPELGLIFQSLDAGHNLAGFGLGGATYTKRPLRVDLHAESDRPYVSIRPGCFNLFKMLLLSFVQCDPVQLYRVLRSGMRARILGQCRASMPVAVTPVHLCYVLVGIAALSRLKPFIRGSRKRWCLLLLPSYCVPFCRIYIWNPQEVGDLVSCYV